MKKAYKILSIVFIVLAICMITSNVFAVIDMNTINSNTTVNGEAKISDIGNKVISIITSVAMVIAVVVIAILGIKFMMGSSEEKAEYKKTLVPYLVGAILVFGAISIGKLVINIGTGLGA